MPKAVTTDSNQRNTGCQLAPSNNRFLLWFLQPVTKTIMIVRLQVMAIDMTAAEKLGCSTGVLTVDLLRARVWNVLS